MFLDVVDHLHVSSDGEAGNVSSADDLIGAEANAGLGGLDLAAEAQPENADVLVRDAGHLNELDVETGSPQFFLNLVQVVAAGLHEVIQVVLEAIEVSTVKCVFDHVHDHQVCDLLNRALFSSYPGVDDSFSLQSVEVGNSPNVESVFHFMSS